MARPSSLPTDPHAGSERGVRDLIGTGPGPVETGKGEESPAGADRTARIFSLLDYSRKLIFSTSILLALALGISVIAKATMNRGVLIEPISVPKELAERGITPEAAAHFIVDEMVILSDSADTLKRFDAVGTSGPEFAKPKIEVPGTGISIDTIVYYLRDFLGQSDTKISGEIIIDRPKDDSASEKTKSDSATDKEHHNSLPKFNLRVRIANKGYVHVEPESTDDLRVLFKRAAFPLLEQINPYIAGVAYLRQKDFVPATRMAEIELRTGATENQMWALNLLGSIARDQNRTGMAIAQFENMVERFPNFPMGHYNLGQIQHTEENYQSGIQASLEGARIDPDPRRRALGYSNAGSSFNEMRKKEIKFDRDDKNADGILLALKKIVKDKVSLAELQNGGVPTSDLAVQLFRAAMEADPTFSTAYLVWGRIERENKNFIEATALFEKSIAAKPKNLFPYRDMGSLYISQGDWDNAAKFFREATSINPNSYFDHYSLGRALGEARKYDAAFAELQTALKLNPKYAWIHLSWAQTLARRADEEKGDVAQATKKMAVEHLKASLELLPNNHGLITEVSTTYEMLGMIEDAAAVYGKLSDGN
jgi:tetratricopeptide (TPR) repeat protein